jgi:hypothetical protein
MCIIFNNFKPMEPNFRIVFTPVDEIIHLQWIASHRNKFGLALSTPNGKIGFKKGCFYQKSKGWVSQPGSLPEPAGNWRG